MAPGLLRALSAQIGRVVDLVLTASYIGSGRNNEKSPLEAGSLRLDRLRAAAPENEPSQAKAEDRKAAWLWYSLFCKPDVIQREI